MISENGHKSNKTSPATPAKLIIRINTELTRMIDETQDALLKMKGAPLVFQRARELSIISKSVAAPKWLTRTAGAPVIIALGQDHLTEMIAESSTWAKLDKRARKWLPATPPASVVRMLMARPEWKFPLLEGIVQTPTLRPDGSVLESPGYDPSTALWLDFNGVKYPTIREKPTRDNAVRAVTALKTIFEDFPFAGGHHRSATIAALLSLVCRYAIQGNVPLFPVRATVRGSGKGLLIDAISMVATGRPAPRWAQTRDEEEERKRLLTIGASGDALVHIDNVNQPLGSGPLDLALTAPSFTDRILGTQIQKEVPMNVVFFASGNNASFRGDMARRVVPIDLDPVMERPEDRTGFKHSPLLDWVAQNRTTFVVAAITILKAYFQAGTPKQGLTPYGSFEEWSNLVRSALVWLDEPDPNEGRKDIEAESDDEYEKLATLLPTWEQCYSNEPATLKRVLQDIELYAVHEAHQPGNKWNDLRDAIGAYDFRYDGKRIDQRRVGNEIKKQKGRVVAGKRLAEGGMHANAIQWYVRSV